MSTNNPSITVSDIVTDVNNRLDGTNLDTSEYLPWISYAYQQLYLAITKAGKYAKEYYFGANTTFNLTASTAEYSLSTNIPRFGGVIKVEIKYGGTDDQWVTATPLQSLSNYKNTANVSTSYRSKESALYYIAGDTLGFIPTPPSTDSGTPQAKVWYVKRPYQLDDSADVIDVPYRFMYPLLDYVQAKALQAEGEFYAESLRIEREFQIKLQEITSLVVNELGEYEQSSIRPRSSRLNRNPLARV